MEKEEKKTENVSTEQTEVKENVTPVETPAPAEAPAETKEAETKKEEPAKEEAKPEEAAPQVGIGEEIPMSEAEIAAKKAAQEQNFNAKEEVVYKMKAEKGANPIGVAIFFALLIGFVLFLPKIVSKYGSIFEQKHHYFDSSQNLPGDEKDPEEGSDTTKKDTYSFAKADRVKVDELTFLNFVKSNLNNGQYTLTFSVVNESESLFDFKTKYYIELYNGDIKISEKLIHSYESIAPKSAVQVTVALNKEDYNSSHFKITKRTTDDYPEVKLVDKDADYDKLTCVKDNNTMVYYFKDNLLEKIDDDIRVSNDSENYGAQLEEAKQRAETLRAIEGIDSNVIETSQSGYNLKTNIDLSTTQPNNLTALKQYKYFIFHEKAKVVKYEMTALTYTCS